MKNPNVVLKIPHTSDCSALAMVQEGGWGSPWYMPRNPITFYGDKVAGHRGSTTRWIIYHCNSTRCNGRAFVRGNWFEDMIHKELEKK